MRNCEPAVAKPPRNLTLTIMARSAWFQTTDCTYFVSTLPDTPDSPGVGQRRVAMRNSAMVCFAGVRAANASDIFAFTVYSW